MHRQAAFMAAVVPGLVVAGAVLVACGCGSTEAPTEPTATPIHSRADTGLACDNVVTQADIDSLQAYDKLTLPFEPCAAFSKEPASVTGGYHNSPSVDFFAPVGTRIVAPWDGTMAFYPLSRPPMAEGGYIAHISNASRTLDARIYVFEDGSNPAHGKFLENPGELQEVKRGDLIGFVGSPLPPAMTDTGATVELELAEWPGLRMFDPAQGDYWVGGQMNFCIPQLP
jgi:hypothetical protein